MGRGAIPGAMSVRKCLLEPPNFSKGEAYTGDPGQGGGNQSRARKGREKQAPGGEGFWETRSERENMASGDLQKSLGKQPTSRLNGAVRGNAEDLTVQLTLGTHVTAKDPHSDLTELQLLWQGDG